MSQIRILATEDDALHEEMLRITLENLGYDLIDVLFKPSDLFKKIAATKPDLLLMDIDLGDEMSGIDLIKEVNRRYDIPVIYVTSFADSDTFNEAKLTFPAAYIVKPYVELELQRAIELAISNRNSNPSAAKGWTGNFLLNKYIYIKQNQTLVKFELSAIQLIEAYDKYCFIYAEGKKIMVRARLKDISEQLPSDIFCQVHRSFVVNFNAIEKIELKTHSIYISGKRVSISKTYKPDLFSRLNFVV
jgi:DNA-binding LytR/AlgR family response regulator